MVSGTGWVLRSSLLSLPCTLKTILFSRWASERFNNWSGARELLNRRAEPRTMVFSFKKKIFIYLFGCVESSLHHAGSFIVACGFSSCRAWA